MINEHNFQIGDRVMLGEDTHSIICLNSGWSIKFNQEYQTYLTVQVSEVKYLQWTVKLL